MVLIEIERNHMHQMFIGFFTTLGLTRENSRLDQTSVFVCSRSLLLANAIQVINASDQKFVIDGDRSRGEAFPHFVLRHNLHALVTYLDDGKNAVLASAVKKVTGQNWRGIVLGPRLGDFIHPDVFSGRRIAPMFQSLKITTVSSISVNQQ